jgi:hypothetical protein
MESVLCASAAAGRPIAFYIASITLGPPG